MPKQLLEIKDFQGVNYQVDSSDAPNNTALYAKNVDFYTEYGLLQGRISDHKLDINSDDSTTSDDIDVYPINVISSDSNVNDLIYIDSGGALKVLPSVRIGTTEPESGNIVQIATGLTDYKQNTSVVKNQSIHFGQTFDTSPPVAKWVGYLSYGQWWHDSGNVPAKTPANYYTGHDECKPYNDEFTMTTPSHNSTASQGIISGYKYFYKYSLTYDGYQESPLVAPDTGTNSFVATNTNQIQFDFSIDTEANLSKRVSHVNFYRAYSPSGGAEEETPYRYLKRVALDTQWSSGGTGVLEFTDNGITTSSYEAITGINEVVGNTSINYTVSTDGNDFHFVAGGTQTDIGDAKNYIFRSKPFKYSVFDWSVDFLILPETPTALKFWNGRLYAFGKNTIYRIEPNNFYIEDTFEGAGASHQKAILTTEQGMFHFDNNHVYINNGTQSKVISKPIEFPNQNANSGDISSLIAGFSLNGILSGNLGGTDNIIAYNPVNNSILITYKSNTYSRAFVYSIDQNSWHNWDTPYISASQQSDATGYFIVQGVCFICYKEYGSSGHGGVFAITSPTKIDSNQQATRAPFHWISNKIMLGNNSQQKSLLKIDSDKTSGTTIKATLINNYSIVEFDDLDSSDFTTISSLSLPSKCYSLQLEIEGGDGQDKLSTVSLNYRTLRGTPT
jgi:hypothetical protein